MNNYHVYEAIGTGKNSTVYKGRVKKTLEYRAVKSVDKSQRSRIHEVRMLHSLDHPNILKFYAWYETSAHFWLVLEYCVGGDLKSLLEQDGHLPENSIHDLAYDLAKALLFLHSKGIIYCDLKPSNILMDEYGCMKLCDFGLARRINDIGKSPLEEEPRALRGTPCYMAPELFQEGGVHSYASDLWSLGCVLFECYTGAPPFTGKEFTRLVKSIISDPTPTLPGNPSKSFENLINSLLIKDPAERLQWSELSVHSFWRTSLGTAPLPSQPAFDRMIQRSAPLSEKNGDKIPRQRTPQKSGEQLGVHRKDENTINGARTPIKGLQSVKRANPKPSGRADPSKGVNILRMSRMAKLNLQRQNEKDNYRRPAQETRDNEAEVKIENNDMELDFSENPEDDAADDPEDSENQGNISESNPPSAIADEREKEGCALIRCISLDNDSSSENTLMKKSPEHQSLGQADVVSTPSCGIRKVNQAKVTSDSAHDMDESEKLLEAFWHPTDLSVKPVMPGKKGDRITDTVPVLPFEVYTASEFVKLTKEELNAFNSKVIQILSGSCPVSEKQGVIRYLEMLSGNSDAAYVITNGPVMLLLIKMLRLSKAPALRLQIASVMGLLIRHSADIEVDLLNSGILSALTDGIRDKQDKLRRLCIAALGELLFYISTQAEHNNKDGSFYESPSKDNKTATSWQVPSSVLAMVASILHRGEDDIAQLYALRAIDNICTQGTEWTSRFASKDVVGNLCYIYKATGKQESTRLIAGSCLVRLARFSPSCIQLIFEKLTLKDIFSTVVKPNPREQQISLNLLTVALLNGHSITHMSRHIVSLAEEKQLVPVLMSLIEQGTEFLRGKALVFVALICKNSRRCLPQFLCNSKLLSAVDRLGKEKNNYLHRCTDAFVQFVASLVPGILDTIASEIQQAMGGKRHGPVAALTGRANPKGAIHLLPVILHLLGTLAFKHRVITSHVMHQLANLTKLVEISFQGRDDLQMTLLRILEAISEETSVILAYHQVLVKQVLPSLSILYKGNKDGDARFLCLKILFDVMVVISDPSFNADKEIQAGVDENLRTISYNYFLPLYHLFIVDEDPIPTYAQKLLVLLIEHGQVKVSDILQQETVSQCFEVLLGDIANANLSNVKLCFALASSPDLDTRLLDELQIVRKIGHLLEFVAAREMEELLEPTLGLCREFIFRGIGSKKATALSQSPALLFDTTFIMSIAVDQQHVVRDIGDFCGNVSIFLELVRRPDDAIITDLASDCMLLLLQAAPREATMGLLTHLPKISRLVELLHPHVHELQLLRLLYGLAFSCRQYLSQALILSISKSAILQLEIQIRDLMNSDVRTAAAAAAFLMTELQRLPRCG